MSLLGQRPDVGEFRKRYKWMALSVVVLMSVLIGKLIHLQVIRHAEFAGIAHDNIVHRVTLATSRGVIRDRNGTVLAASRESWNVYVVPARLDLEKTWPKLAELLGLGPVERATVEARLRAQRDADLTTLRTNPKHRIREAIVREDVSRDVIGALETNRSHLAAVNWISVPMRYYPTKDLTFHLLGYVNEVSKDDLDAQAAAQEKDKKEWGTTLQPGDRVGRSGVERAWESYLRGQRGWKKVVLDARGNRRTQKEDLAQLDLPVEQSPVPGRDVRLTIDADLTASARRAFAGQLAGSVVVVEVKTGRLLTVYSKPGVDPNDFVAGLTPKQAEGILANPLRPLIDKTMYEAYFPGSTMKPFAALAALGTKAITPHGHETCEHIYVLGKTRFKCEGFHGQIELHDALVRSCNIFFYHLGEKTGIDAMAAVAAEFGFGQRTGVGINHEVPGLVPTKAWYSQHYGGQFRLGFTLNAAIGQGNTKVTVLQLAMAYAALGNGGTLFAPQVVRSIESPPVLGPDGNALGGGAVEIDFAPRARRKINLDPADLRAVLDGMHGVVNEPGGTAHRERTTKVDVAGKTGTAQVSKVTQKAGMDPRSIWYFNRDHAWFAGVAPFDDPEIAVVVLVEHGGGGGHNAAPIAMRVIEDWFTKIKPAREQAAHPKPAAMKGATP
ncbi:MAG: penicillin-binding protein 2 [Deltaproteobacteria bacterium]|nr:penicillin-binding protein 2 [Deltaproteobacteria bacterium]